MSLCINGAPEFDPLSWANPSFKKFTEIRNPDPCRLFVFLEVQEDEIFDCNFGMPTLAIWGDVKTWWDIPASRHSVGCGLSFGDGHAERHKWRVPKTFSGTLPQPVPDPELPDYRWMQAGYRQSWN